MKRLGVVAAGVMDALAGCVSPEGGAAVAVDPNLRPVAQVTKDALREKAAGYQDLSDVRVDQRDGCLVYLHRGPVETTYLPLRNRADRPICTELETPAET